MLKYFIICISFTTLISCKPAYETHYGMKKLPEEILDLRSIDFILGTPAEIEHLYSERLKNKSEGNIILKSITLPKYPRDMLEAGIEGKVYIEFIVNKKGRVENPQIIWSSYKKFNEPSLKALKKWRFEPILKNGKTVTAHLKHAFVYSLDNT